MKKLVVLISLALVFPTFSAEAATTKVCSYKQVDKIKNGLICKKIGYVYRWTELPKPATTKTQEVPKTEIAKPEIGVCDVDPLTPKEWLAFDSWYRSLGGCSSPYRIVESSLVSETPTTITSDALMPIDSCMIQDSRSHLGTNGFGSDNWFFASRHPSPKTVFQIIPIYSEDAPLTGNTPMQDYSAYFNYVKKYLEYNSDVPSSVEFRVPDNYIKFNGKLSNYNVTHLRTNEQAATFLSALISQVDNSINFAGANMALVLVPSGTPESIFEQSGLDRVNTNEGNIIVDAMAAPNFENKRYMFYGLKHPAWWLHEMWHTGLGLADTADGPTQTMGHWGIMGRSTTDLLGWHKWLLGFYANDQIKCQSPTSTSVSWVVPSTVKSSKTKLVMIPLGNNKAIGIESIRPYGFNFKLGKEAHGALVYLIDETVTDHNDGMMLLNPSNRSTRSTLFEGSNSVLKLNDYIVYNNIKITVIEAGAFGDVIKVERK